ncbi:polysaccharide biosynthesis tyrosine autokinase [Aliiroseovarius sp. N1Y82]|nr:polysaccharide biosynthesis tyrosine autokinase [Aliiroseovarius subalbicans]
MELLRTLWRGKHWIALCLFLVGFAGAYFAYGIATPVYTAKAVVTLESRQEQVVDLTSVMTGLTGDQTSINTEIEVMRSRGLAEKLVTRLDLTKDPEFNVSLREERLSINTIMRRFARVIGTARPRIERTDTEVLNQVVDAVLASIKISNVRQSYVFNIIATTESPEKASLLANSLADIYIEDQLEVKFQATRSATKWLTDRVAQLQVDLETAEAEVENFNANTSLINQEALVAQNRQVKDLRDRLAAGKATLAETTARLEMLQSTAAGNDTAAMAEAANDAILRQILLRLETSESNDLSPFTARFDQVLARAGLEVSRAKSQVQALSTTINQLSASIEQQSNDLVQLQQLQREATASRQIYEYFLTRLKETSVQQGVQQADSRVLSHAIVPRTPSAPRKLVITLLSMMLGTAAGATLVLLREVSLNTFRSTPELEKRTHTTVLGQIPSISARRRKNVLKYLTDKPTSAAVEAIRNLRTSILMSNMDKPPQVIMATSSIPGEGKTTLSIALTHNLSGLGKRVLLVEGDIRRRVFSEYFDIHDKKGLLAVLSGEEKLEDAVFHHPDLKADILIGERSSTNAADVFSSERFGAFLDELRAAYDYIVIDTPPVLAVPDARVIGQRADAIIYCVKWDSTTHRQVQQGLKSFSDVNVKVTGLTLNQVNMRGMKRYGYGDSYGAYSNYYDG